MKFYLKHAGQNRWLQHSNGGGGFRFFTDNNNAENSQITLIYASSVATSNDYYQLDGKTYGIAYHDDTATGSALMGEAKNGDHLASVDLLMRSDVLDKSGILLVAENSDITEWTFHCVENNVYTITATVDGAVKYLTLSGTSLTLSDEAGDNARFTVVPGAGANTGKYQIAVGEYKLAPELTGSTAGKGFYGTKSDDTSTWLNLVEKSVLNDDDFTLYTAKKISISGKQTVQNEDAEGNPVTREEYVVPNGAQAIIYTRIWNDTLKKYEFFAVDHDGSLIRCYDTGDNIEWIGTKVNTALWDFTEYYNSDGTESYY